MHRKLLVALLGVSLAVLAGSRIARADGDVSFGIRPVKALEGRTETFSYFSRELAPGAVLNDEALVLNDGDVPLALTLYAADGVTAQNAGTAFASKGVESTGASRGVSLWLSLSVTEIALKPGEERVVPFTITVPPNASPGHHVAGLVVEAPPTEGGDGQFAVNVVRRVGVAVVIDVPGPHVAGLEITGACLREQDDHSATFVVAVHNTGDIFVKGEGSLPIRNSDGGQLASVPLEMDTVLPGDATTFQTSGPVRLPDGDYLLNAVLNYEGKTASLDGVRIKVRDGQPVVGCEPPEDGAFPPTDTTDIAPTLAEHGGPPIGRYVVYGAPFLALALALFLTVARRVRRRTRA